MLRVPFIAKLEEDNVREGFIEHAQYSALLNALPDHLKAMFVVGYHVGNRSGELKKLTWSQVDLKGGEIKLNRKQTKGKKHRTLPIYGDMAAWLDMQKTHRDEMWPDCDLVFHYLGRPIGSHMKGWSRACKVAGLNGLRFHDLRRSAVRNLERSGVPRKIAMSITGHKTESIYQRYDIVSQQDMSTAREKMNRFFDSQKPPVVTVLVTPAGRKN